MGNLINKIIAENKVPENWDLSVTMKCFKNKGNGIERGNYRGLKLLEHMTKVFERVIKQKIREVIGIDAVQFGLMPGKGTTNANFSK